MLGRKSTAPSSHNDDLTVLPQHLRGEGDGWWLDIITPEGSSWRKTLQHGDTLIIGRDQSADIFLNDKQASRQHARIWQKQGDWYVTDLGSHNGTLVNGDIIRIQTPLNSLDSIQVGKTILTMKQGETLKQSATPDNQADGRLKKDVMMWSIALALFLTLSAATLFFMSSGNETRSSHDDSISVQDRPKEPLNTHEIPADNQSGKTADKSEPDFAVMAKQQDEPQSLTDQLIKKSTLSLEHGNIKEAYVLLNQAKQIDPQRTDIGYKIDYLAKEIDVRFDEMYQQACDKLRNKQNNAALIHLRSAATIGIEGKTSKYADANSLVHQIETNKQKDFQCN